MCSPQENTLVFRSSRNIFTIVAEKYKKNYFGIIQKKIPSNWLISFHELFGLYFFKLSCTLSHAFWFFTAFFLKLVYNLWDNEISWNIRLSNSQGFLQIVQNIFSENCSGSNSSQYPPAQWAPWWFIKKLVKWNELISQVF